MDNVKKYIKYVPGFRSNTLWKKIIAIIYYVCVIATIAQGIGSVIVGLALPFIFFFFYDRYKRKENSGSTLKESNSSTLVPVKANIIMQQGEECYYTNSAVRLKPKTVTIGYKGGYTGVSFRVAKGVTLHTGGTTRQAIKENIMEKYQGTLYITNKRILFVAQQNGFTLPLNKLVTVTLFKNAYQLHKDEVTYIMQPKNLRKFGTTLQKVINNYL